MLGSVSRDILRRPGHYRIARWNWKVAVASASVRGALFFWSSGTSSTISRAAVSSSAVEFMLAFALAGFGGALTQACRYARPQWLAILAASCIPRIAWHAAEFAVHVLWHTPHLYTGMMLSIAYSAVATIITVRLMRRGLLLVGEVL